MARLMPARRESGLPPITAGHVRLWLAAVALVLAIGSGGYMVMGWSFTDAAYMTVITLTTVGFKEVRELDAIGRAWTMLLAIAGIAIIFGTIGIIAEFLVGEQLSGRVERRRVTQQLRELRDHFVLCGFGRVGSMAAEELRHAGQAVVVIDLEAESLERASQEGMLAVAGDAADDAVLRQAGLDRARGIVITTDVDAQNVYITLSARALNPKIFIVARANAAGAEAKLSQAGADRVVSPYTMAGRRVAELATRPRVADFLDAALSHGELAFTLEEVVVEAGGPLEGRTVGELREEGVYVLAVVRGRDDYEPHPAPDRRLAPDESLILSGATETLARFRGRR
jgi:voltage-gated potassium channel